MTDEKNWRIIPEYPSYKILGFTGCNRCPKYPSLKKMAKDKNLTQNELVFIEHWPPEFDGDAKRIMFVGESPGATEMRLLRPFIGKSGNIFRQAVKSALEEHDKQVRMLITNTVKCRCLGRPDFPEIRACLPSLAKEADLFAPHLIIGLGKTAFLAMADKGYENILGDNRNRRFKYRGFDLRVTYHPAAAFHHTHYRISLYQDLRKYIRELLT